MRGMMTGQIKGLQEKGGKGTKANEETYFPLNLP
jgi:hypothetical protein